MKKWILLLAFFCPFALTAQIITTFLGTGSGGVTGDGGPATSATYSSLQGMTFDKFGNFYYSELENEIRFVNIAGIINLYAGTGALGFSGDTGPASAATFKFEEGVVCDTVGNLYISDHQNFRIRKVDFSTGIINTIAGNGSGIDAGDGGLAIDASFFPSEILFDKRGNLYITEASNNRIRKIDKTGTITTFAGTGVMGYSGDGAPATSAKLWDPFWMAIDNKENLYFTDFMNKRVRKIDTFGIITTIAGTGLGGYNGDGIPATAANITPYGVGVDHNDNIYIADTSGRIRMVDALGTIHTVVGTGVPGYNGDGIVDTEAQINGPGGIIFDDCNTMYFADGHNYRIRKVSFPIGITLTNNISTLIATVCAGTPTTFTATATTSGGTITYQWYLNGTPIPGATTSTYNYTPADADSIRCIATATSPCTSAVTSSNSIIMSVTPITTPTITVTAPPAAAIGSTVTVNATVAGITGTGYSINWYNNSALFSTTSAPTTTYTKPPGTDHVTATIVPPTEGCYDSTASAAVAVAASTTGVRNTSLSFGEGRGEAIYPNPVKDILYIDHTSLFFEEGRGEVSYKILSVIGAAILQGALPQGSNPINVKDLPAGVYMLEVVYPSGDRVTNKIVKE